MLPEGWGAAEDDRGRIWYYDFEQYPPRVQYEPPEVEEDSSLTWREVLSLSEATGLATELAGGRPLSPMPPLIPIPPGFHDRLGGGGPPGGSGGGGGGGGRPAVPPAAPPGPV